MAIPIAVVLASAAALLILMAYATALQDDDSGTVLVLFPPGTRSEHIFEAVLEADGRLVTSTWLDSAWIVNGNEPGFVRRLKKQGALSAFNPQSFQSFAVAGCALAIPGDLLPQTGVPPRPGSGYQGTQE